MPKQINTYTFGQQLVQKFGLKGRFQPVLDETIVPVTVVESSIAVRPAVGGVLGVISGAGNQNQLFMSNPANSGVVVKIVEFWAVSGAPTTDFIQVKITPVAITLSGTRLWRDSSLAGSPKVGFTRAAVGAAVLAGPLYHLDVDSKTWEPEWILHENTKLEIQQSGQNTTLDFWCAWTEQAVTASLAS